RKWGIWESFGSTQNGVKSTPCNTRQLQKTRSPSRMVLNVPLERERWAAMKPNRLFWPRTARVARPQQIWWMWAKERKRANMPGNEGMRIVCYLALSRARYRIWLSEHSARRGL